MLKPINKLGARLYRAVKKPGTIGNFLNELLHSLFLKRELLGRHLLITIAEMTNHGKGALNGKEEKRNAS